MRLVQLLGLTINLPALFRKANPPIAQTPGMGDGGWWPLIVREPFAGAWQRNQEMRLDTTLSNVAVFRCINLISSDIAKLRPRIVQEIGEGTSAIWEETFSAAFSPVLEKPNNYQTRIQFWENWISSKLNRGNTYVLKERDGRGLVTSLFVLDPDRCRPLVATNGDVYYRLKTDLLAGVFDDDVIVPASEIIHDRMNCWFHPLVGLSPLFAAGLAANQAINIQQHSNDFFRNGANPGGILTAPGRIHDDTAQRIKGTWQAEFTGSKVGRVAVLGDGLKYEPMTMTAVNSQLIEQWRLSSEMICIAFGVPAQKIGLSTGTRVRLTLAEQDVQYYEQTLQIYLESAEACLDTGLALPSYYGTQFDLAGLMRMDQLNLTNAIEKAVGAGVMTPNEGRARLGLRAKEGGDSPMMQQQNYSLVALHRRDEAAPPPGPKPTTPPPAPATPPPDQQARHARLVNGTIRAAERHARRLAANT